MQSSAVVNLFQELVDKKVKFTFSNTFKQMKHEFIHHIESLVGERVIFIGTPVWAWTFTPALRTFLSTVKLQNKKIALFCCHGGQAGKTFDKMKAFLNGDIILGEKDFEEPLKNNKENSSNKAIQWAKDILTGY